MSFEEEFPSLMETHTEDRPGFMWFGPGDLQRCCIDKQKARDIIKKRIEFYRDMKNGLPLPNTENKSKNKVRRNERSESFGSMVGLISLMEELGLGDEDEDNV